MRILLGDFNAKLARGDIVKPTTGRRGCIRILNTMVLE
jgi:hypothetical protein